MGYGKEIDAQILEIINRRELQMIVHSCIYYRMGTSLWSDIEFDSKARELVQLIKDHPNTFEKSHWVNSFRDWDATTGFHLPIEDSAIVKISQFLVDYHNGTEKSYATELKGEFIGGTNTLPTPKEPSSDEKKTVIIEDTVDKTIKPDPKPSQLANSIKTTQSKPNAKAGAKQNKLF